MVRRFRDVHSDRDFTSIQAKRSCRGCDQRPPCWIGSLEWDDDSTRDHWPVLHFHLLRCHAVLTDKVCQPPLPSQLNNRLPVSALNERQDVISHTFIGIELIVREIQAILVSFECESQILCDSATKHGHTHTHEIKHHKVSLQWSWRHSFVKCSRTSSKQCQFPLTIRRQRLSSQANVITIYLTEHYTRSTIPVIRSAQPHFRSPYPQLSTQTRWRTQNIVNYAQKSHNHQGSKSSRHHHPHPDLAHFAIFQPYTPPPPFKTPWYH